MTASAAAAAPLPAPATRLAARRGASPAPHRWVGPAAVAAAYLLATALLFAPILPHLGDRLIGGRTGRLPADGYLFTWWMSYLPWALAHGHNPFTTTLLNAPAGVNALWNTSFFAPALLLSPVTLAAGPVAAVDLVLIASPPLSATAAYLMCRRLGARTAPAAVGGALYGFGPYVVNQAAIHPNLALLWFPPVVVILLHALACRDGRPSWQLGALLGAAVAVQYFCSSEVLATTALTAAVAVVLAAVFAPRVARRRAARTAAGLLTAAVVAGVALAYPLDVQFRGPQHVAGLVTHPGRYVTTLVALVAPSGTTWLDPLGLRPLTVPVAGNVVESSGYLGVPLLALTAWILVRHLRERRVAWAVLVAVAAEVASFGDTLRLSARTATSVHLPWALLAGLPVFKDVITARFSAYALLFLGLLLAWWLSQPRSGAWPRAGAWAAVAAAAVFLIPARPLMYAARPVVPAFFSTPADYRQVPAGSVVAVIPPVSTGTAPGMLWQAETGMRFAITSGYAKTASSRGTVLSALVVRALRGLHPAVPPPAELTADLRARGVCTVLVPLTDRAGRASAALTARWLARPGELVGGVRLWRVCRRA